jgi:type VI secretion system secreted protein VgrG
MEQSGTYTQDNRPIAVTTPLGKDTLLLEGFRGVEAISQLFRFELHLLALNEKTIPFDKLLGRPVTIKMADSGDQERFFNGIVNRVWQGGRDAIFTTYRVEIVPQLWLLTKKAQSRIFQQMTVPEILKTVLAGLGVDYQGIQGTFHPRDYCVQYRETDFNFVSRLLEEEGIYYYFKHADGSHKLVLANKPQSHMDLGEVSYGEMPGDDRSNERIDSWEKAQELRSGKYTLWDYCFEKPESNFEACKSIMPAVQVGQVLHHLQLGSSNQLEIFDFPGEFAQRFDGIAPGGADRSGDVAKIYQHNEPTAALRMQQEALSCLAIVGSSNCSRIRAGQRFSLARHFNANGRYVLTSVQHVAFLTGGGYRSGGGSGFRYQNSFTCIPLELPFRPQRTTAKPFVQGTQTAVVVGPEGEEIFTDKYGRVKVQFHWDRAGRRNADSSCWVRVATPWAGKNWGMIHIPRIGQEVVVAFEEGDPDQPIIIGSVYNAAMIPPYALPRNKTQSGIKTRSTLNGSHKNFNELRFEDKKDSEDIYFHAEKDFHRVVENNDDLKIEKGNRTVTLEAGDETTRLQKGSREVKIEMGSDTLTISQGDQKTKVDLGKHETEAMQSIELKVGQSSIKLDQTGITIKGLKVELESVVQTAIKGLMTQLQGTAMLQVKSDGVMMIG